MIRKYAKRPYLKLAIVDPTLADPRLRQNIKLISLLSRWSRGLVWASQQIFQHMERSSAIKVRVLVLSP